MNTQVSTFQLLNSLRRFRCVNLQFSKVRKHMLYSTASSSTSTLSSYFHRYLIIFMCTKLTSLRRFGYVNLKFYKVRNHMLYYFYVLFLFSQVFDSFYVYLLFIYWSCFSQHLCCWFMCFMYLINIEVFFLLILCMCL